MRVRRKLIKSLVDKLLLSNKLGTPRVDVERLARSLKLEIIRQEADDSVSGFLINADGKSIIGVNSAHPANRQRFTIAHEIGHYLLHNYHGVHFDGRTTGQIYMRDQNSSTGERLDEREANFFAAELLMPESLLESDLAKIDHLNLIDQDDFTLQKLAAKYGVSVRAITYRLANLGILEL